MRGDDDDDLWFCIASKWELRCFSDSSFVDCKMQRRKLVQSNARYFSYWIREGNGIFSVRA